MTKQYELTVLLPSEYSQDEVKKFCEGLDKMVTSKEGKVISEENLGKKALAYMINKMKEAQYLFFVLSIDTQYVQKLEHDVRLTEGVMRSLLVTQESTS